MTLVKKLCTLLCLCEETLIQPIELDFPLYPCQTSDLLPTSLVLVLNNILIVTSTHDNSHSFQKTNHWPQSSIPYQKWNMRCQSGVLLLDFALIFRYQRIPMTVFIEHYLGVCYTDYTFRDIVNNHNICFM